MGYDLSPFACLIARVKTTPVDADAVRAARTAVLAARAGRAVLDDGDRACLGLRIADEVTALAGGLRALVAPPAVLDLLRLALIHALKIAGRRDFAADSIRPHFTRTAERILVAVGTLPPGGPPARFVCASNHDMAVIPDGAARLVVTSPPYKDLDVEYALLQLQRRDLRKSKRSQVIWALLGEPPRGKSALCGGRGAAYWRALAPSLAETRRVLAAGAAAFIWTGFKTPADAAAFAAAGFTVRHTVPVRLSDDRVASSRSTHHGRATGMLARDTLFACVAE